MDGMNIFISDAAKTTELSKQKCDEMIRSIVKAVNNGALGAGNQMSQLAKLKKKKFTTANNLADIVSADTGYDREECKKVSTWMVDKMIQTINQGGMPALIRMVNLMKKGQQAEKGEVDYSQEVKEINEMLEKA